MHKDEGVFPRTKDRIEKRKSDKILTCVSNNPFNMSNP